MIRRLAPVFFAAVIAVAVIGFLVGIAEGVPKPHGQAETALVATYDQESVDSNHKLIPAVAYSEIAGTSMGPTSAWREIPQSLPHSEHDLYAKITLSESAKLASSKLRASRRAFNGAPPVIPHPAENTTDAACYACHGNGVTLTGMKASVMSHPFLGNCVQCHAPMAPAPFRSIDTTVDTSFVGLPAPQQGKRASLGAPPTIPHSRWMRDNCHACHGGPDGWAGMESTHPWRTNCTQCHAPSAALDQMPETDVVPMLPPLDVVSK